MLLQVQASADPDCIMFSHAAVLGHKQPDGCLQRIKRRSVGVAAHQAHGPDTGGSWKRFYAGESLGLSVVEAFILGQLGE